MRQKPSVPAGFFFKGQLAHLLLLSVLLGVVWRTVEFGIPAERNLFGIRAQLWLMIALAVPIVHQVFVWIVWRSELCFRTLTNRFGSGAFAVYEAIFLVLLLSRPLSLILVAVSDGDSLDLSLSVRAVAALVLAVPAIYTLYSVVRYFGIARAVGRDHFDPTYRDLPMVRQGIFRFTSNAMYTYAFLILWSIAIAYGSRVGMIVAFFNHAYIWVHYVCTERPDMHQIYRD